MILNPSHEITLKGLPSEILDAYVRYKKGSRAIVSWLVQFGPQKYKGVKTLPIKELASLAQSVIQSIKELPEVIHFHFRETIAARKRLSQYFRKSIDLSEDDTDTVNHEHFTTSLTQIYSDLCKHCQTCDAHKLLGQRRSWASHVAEPIKNHYACLPIEESFDDLEIVPEDPACGECEHEQAYQCPGARTDLVIEEDEISVAIETASTLERIHETLMTVESCWKSAGSDQTHFVSAAGTTNVAWSILRDCENQLKGEDELLSLEVLHQKCCLFKNVAEANDGALSKVHTLLESLAEADRAVSHYSNRHKLTIFAHCPSCIQKPSEYIQSATAAEGEERPNFCLALMDNILHLMCGDRPNAIILQGSPIYADIGYLLTHRSDKSTSFQCVLGIHLLTTAYRAYLSSLPNPMTISSCRITALKLAKQASKSISTILVNKDSFPCKCPQTLAFHLSNLQDTLEAYAKHKAWDLYFQSPWTSGSHIIEMLDMLSYYGMRLFHYRHYIGAILHSYNVLAQLGGLEPIPILEQLCEIFKEVFFPSGRPTDHFKNSWARYIGARLKFKKGHKRHINDKDAWCMAVPAHAAKNAAGLGIENDRSKHALEPKFDYAKIDPMMELKKQNWRIDLSLETKSDTRRDSAYSSRPSSSGTGTSRSPSSSRPSTDISPRPASSHHDPIDINSSPTLNIDQHPLTTLQATLSTHLTQSSTTTSTTPLPTTRLSHLAIFHTSVSLISAITTKTHTEPSEKETKLCICFAHTLLAGADRIVEGRRFGGVECWKKEERDVVSAVKEVLEGEFGGAEEGKVRRNWFWEL